MASAATVLTSSPPAAILTGLVRSLADSAGVEYSVKASPSGVEVDRMLMSWAASGCECSALTPVFQALDLPHQAQDEIAASLPHSRFLHFGIEGGAASRVKFYCERSLTKVSQEDPLYTAWKWAPGIETSLSVDDYRPSHVASLEAAEGLIEQAYADKASGIVAALFRFLRRAVVHEDLPLFLDVRSRASQRASFDMRCYDFGMRVADAEEIVAAADRDFACAGSLKFALERNSGEVLGHMAGGIGSDGLPFITFYFGARALV